MEYHEAANFLFDLRRYPPRMELQPTRRLLSALGNPQDGLRVVQVAGSNGKGSVARMTESVLRETGLDVGLYTSPELDDVRERVRIDGRKVSKRAVSEFVEHLREYAAGQPPDGTQPTFFESTTALALWAFDRAGVDVAVVEVGIGGRYDATSVTTPEASAVTSVTLEHADVLGDTVEEIARDMAAVEPEDAPLVTGATGEALDAIEAATDDVRTVGIDDEDADVRVTDHGTDGLEQRVDIAGAGLEVETSLPLLGSHQSRNAGIAAAVARQVTDASAGDVARGLRNAYWPGRFEVLDRSPLTVADGAHNPAGCAALAETLGSFDFERLHLVFGAMVDKDHTGMVEALPAADVVYTCRPEVDRAEVPPVLAAEFEADGRAGDVADHDSVAGALAAALGSADPDDAVVIAGSLYTVAEARRRWTRTLRRRRIPDEGAERAVLSSADVPPAAADRVRGQGVHHCVQFRVQPREAARIKDGMLAAGGACAVSGLAARDCGLADVVLMGTDEQFRHLLEDLDGERGLSASVDALRATIDEDPPATEGYPWEDGTAVMGILNVTPDSFYDGGRYAATEAAVERAEEMVAAGVDIVDVGGESTRPGADPVPADEEVERVVPVVEELADVGALVSVDTRKADVARAALEAGADIINDVSGLEDPEMRLVAAEYDVPVVVMHSIDAPVDPEADVEYDDVVADTLEALVERVLLAEKAGLDRSQIVVDPGIGFGKTSTESFELLGRLEEFRALGCPVLVGHSRKSMFDRVGAEGADDRLAATVAASALAAERGADIVRVHDVAENVAAVRTAAATVDDD